jgi:hypothetical protein
MIRAPTAALASALAAVTTALRECGVIVNRHSPAAAIHRFDYELGGDTVAAVGWADGLFVDPDLPDELAALVRAHAHLACAAPADPFAAPTRLDAAVSLA